MWPRGRIGGLERAHRAEDAPLVEVGADDCTLTGSPAPVTPHGADPPGWPVRLNGTVYGAPWRQRSNSGE